MIQIYSTTWCPDCKAAKMALDQLGLPYHEIDIDQDPQGEQKVLEANQGRRSVPTLVYNGQAVSMSRFSIARLRTWLAEVGLLASA